MSHSTDKFGQGTIEYLVILAVVVIALVVVGLVTGVFSSPSQEITGSSSKTGEVAVGEISIVESVIDPNGDSLIKFSNNSSDSITLKKISVGNVDNSYDTTLVGLDSKGFSLSGLSSPCPCVSGQKSVKCELKIEYLTASGIIKTEIRTINAQCVNDAIAVNENIVISPIDNIAPVVTLSSPTGNVSSKVVDFVFDVTEAKGVNSCTLNIGSDSNVYTNIVNGLNTVRYNFATDKYVDWNVSCIDTSSNRGTSSPLSLDVDSNTFEITTCLELQDMNLNLAGKYVQMNDIDCGADTNNSSGRLWNGGLGFGPIGYIGPSCGRGCTSNYQPFSGTFNGGNYMISNLFINRPTQTEVGLFGETGGTLIQNVNLVDQNIIGKDYVAGIAGSLYMGRIINSSSNGSIRGATNVGGICGDTFHGTILDSFNLGSAEGVTYVGGICGYGSGDLISNSSNSGSIIGITNVGGIVGYSNNSISIRSSFNSGSVTGTDYVGGILGYSENALIRNTYNLGSITGRSYVGGISGISPMIYTSYNVGQVTGTVEYIGGLIGEIVIGSVMTNTFSLGLVTSPGYPDGGVSGYVLGAGTFSNNYWDVNLTNKLWCYSGPNPAGCVRTDNNAIAYKGANGIPFVNLGFDGNWIARDNNYPLLSWQ